MVDRLPGSSPRMRGAQLIDAFSALRRRIIPADAGSTPPPSRGWGSGRDHPRGCGEHELIRLIMTVTGGSSPRMRGAQLPCSQNALETGIIPADAGSTRARSCGCRQSQDHPRGCGEHIVLPLFFGLQYGSSPRMRGAQIGFAASNHTRRIIPADAGSTVRESIHQCAIRDHPRGCGEHVFADDPKSGLRGSSPRMRGALAVPLPLPAVARIIPADAGSTMSYYLSAHSHEDHPRGCGEHVLRDSIKTGAQGSSPRMRGAHPPTAWSSPLAGIIPADAGSTVGRSVGHRTGQDHPRGCGEHGERGT